MNQEVEHEYVLIQILHTRDTLLAKISVEDAPVGTYLVIPAKYGADLAEVMSAVRADQAVHWEELVEPLRIATEEDLNHFEDNKARENEAYDVCRQKIDEHKLDMKLVSVHSVLDEAKIVFFFTSENRVDFRELVKDLVAVFHQRIELRQIGVRDESRIIGGLAVCGRALCCNSISDKLLPVSIKMAKVQNLSLNSMKISGPCGRLLCCLAYEYEAYKSDRKDFPPEGLTLRFEGMAYHIQEPSILGRKVHVRSEDDRFLALPLAAFNREPNGQWVMIGPVPPPVVH